MGFRKRFISHHRVLLLYIRSLQAIRTIFHRDDGPYSEYINDVMTYLFHSQGQLP